MTAATDPTIRHRPLRSGPARGFTLVEMLVVIGIITMILGMSVPVFAVLAQARSIRGAVDIVQGAFMKYREKSATTAKPVFLVFEHWKSPPQFSAWYVEKAPDIANPAVEIITFLRDPADHFFPREVFVHPEGCWHQIDDYSGVPATMRYQDELRALCEDAAAGYTFNSPPVQDPQIQAQARKALIFIFTPEGGVLIFGKGDVPSFMVDGNPPNGDILIHNEDSRIYIDVNRITGRVRWSQVFNQ